MGCETPRASAHGQLCGWVLKTRNAVLQRPHSALLLMTAARHNCSTACNTASAAWDLLST